jgi:hypothetical protein
MALCIQGKAEIHTGQHIFFHLNHPIRFIGIVAPIIAIDNIGEKYGLLTLDDGSGATIVAKLNLLDKEVASQNNCPSNTIIPNVNYKASLGSFDVEVDGAIISIGTVIKAKCTVEVFRGDIQLVLKRATVAKSTAEEVRSWKEMARWKRNVLSQPWILTSAELKSYEKLESVRLQRLQREDVSRRQQQKKRKAESWVNQDKRETKRRMREAAMNEGALI